MENTKVFRGREEGSLGKIKISAVAIFLLKQFVSLLELENELCIIMLAIKSPGRYIYSQIKMVYFVMTIGVALEEVSCSDVYPVLFDLSLNKKMLVKLNISIVSLCVKRNYWGKLKIRELLYISLHCVTVWSKIKPVFFERWSTNLFPFFLRVGTDKIFPPKFQYHPFPCWRKTSLDQNPRP